MTTNLKIKLRKALADSSAQRPVETDVLAKGHRRSHVEAALMAMYQAQEIYCCKITNKEGARVVWWISGNVASQTEFYGKRAVTIDVKKAKAAGYVAKPAKPAKTVRRISQFSRDVIDAVKAAPGMSMPELKAKLAAKGETDSRITSAASNLTYLGYLRTEGEMRRYRYFAGPKA